MSFMSMPRRVHTLQFFPFLHAFIVLAVFELFNLAPERVFYFLTLLSIFTLICVWRAPRLPPLQKLRSGTFWWRLLPLLFFLASGFFFSVFLQTPALFHLLAVFMSFFSLVYTRPLFAAYRSPSQTGERGLADVAHFLNTTGVFFWCASIFASFVLLNLSVSLATLATAVLVFGWAVSDLYSQQVDPVKCGLLGVVMGLLVCELLWAMSLLPLNYFILGLLVAVFYHCSMLMLGLWLASRLDFKFARRYIIMGVILSTVLLITAQWR